VCLVFVVALVVLVLLLALTSVVIFLLLSVTVYLLYNIGVVAAVCASVAGDVVGCVCVVDVGYAGVGFTVVIYSGSIVFVTVVIHCAFAGVVVAMTYMITFIVNVIDDVDVDCIVLLYCVRC